MGALSSLAPYYTDWRYLFNPGYYLHRGRVYIQGEIFCADEGSHSSSILTGLPPNLRPTEDTAITLLLDSINAGGKFETSYLTTVLTEGDWVFGSRGHSGFPNGADVPDWGFALNLSNASWPIAAGADTFSGEDLGPYLHAGSYQTSDATIALHGSRVHVAGSVECIQAGDQNIIRNLGFPAKYRAGPGVSDPDPDVSNSVMRTVLQGRGPGWVAQTFTDSGVLSVQRQYVTFLLFGDPDAIGTPTWGTYGGGFGGFSQDTNLLSLSPSAGADDAAQVSAVFLVDPSIQTLADGLPDYGLVICGFEETQDMGPTRYWYYKVRVRFSAGNLSFRVSAVDYLYDGADPARPHELVLGNTSSVPSGWTGTPMDQPKVMSIIAKALPHDPVLTGDPNGVQVQVAGPNLTFQSAFNHFPAGSSTQAPFGSGQLSFHGMTALMGATGGPLEVTGILETDRIPLDNGWSTVSGIVHANTSAEVLDAAPGQDEVIVLDGAGWQSQFGDTTMMCIP